MTTSTDRDAEIAARYDTGESLDELALSYDLPRSTVGEIVRRLTEPRPVGRRPSGAVTPRTARGQALLAQLVTDAAAAGVEPEDHLAAARGSGEE